jgi:hypothetical protein
MRRIAGVFVLLFLGLGLVPSPAAGQTLSVRDVIELTRSGLGDEVLLALIEVNRGVYAIDPATLKSLKKSGVSDRVIAALVRSGRETVVPEPPPPAPVDDVQPPAPQVVVLERPEPEVRQVMVPVPVYVPVVPGHRRGHRASQVPESTFVPFQSGPPAVRPPVKQPAEPVYWGFGGKLRPDAWKPDGYKEPGSGKR